MFPSPPLRRGNEVSNLSGGVCELGDRNGGLCCRTKVVTEQYERMSTLSSNDVLFKSLNTTILSLTLLESKALPLDCPLHFSFLSYMDSLYLLFL